MLRQLIEGMIALVTAWDEDDPPPLQERREQVRLRCHYPVKVIAPNQSFRSVVTDVGPRGMRLKFVGPVRKGNELTIIYDHEEAPRPPVHCRTVWCRKRRFTTDRVAGVEFTGEVTGSWVGEVLEELGFNSDVDGNPRRWVRVDTHFPSRLRSGKKTVDAKVVNLGVGGALLQGGSGVDRGSSVTLELGPWQDLPPLRLQGLVLSLEDDDLIDGSLLRLRFDHLEAQSVDLLGRYVLGILREKHL